MKAIIQENYGDTNVLSLQDILTPTPKENEVLIRTNATSLHIGDWLIMKGKPFVLRMMMGLAKPKQRPGSDVAGVVEAVGSQVTTLKPGDEVFGWCKGGLAEYVCEDATHFTRKPKNVTFQQAASSITSAVTALHAVRDQAKIQPGQKVLVNGASGGVGPFAVQLAKIFGAEVAGVCSTRNTELVSSIGATRVFDYTKEDFTQSGQQYDYILDVAGSRTLSEYKRVLKPGGKVIPIGGPPKMSRVLGLHLRAMFSSYQSAPFVSYPNHDDLKLLGEWMEQEALTPVIDKVYPLHDTPNAFAYLGTGHARAKVVIVPSTL